ncbi:MAG: hypothetical protein L6R41_001883 [Letrouitia leprolyta]|nr:MAG: hypothetical protein L6R41_001883 [Letrouitia leprolyta]
MSTSSLCDLSTRYLLYKAALASKDAVSATTYLDAISMEAKTDFTLLYACVLEARKNEDRMTVIRALSRVLDKTKNTNTPGIQLATLLRTTARLLIEELDDQQTEEVDCIDELCKIFEAAAVVAQASRLQDSETKDDFSIAELDWFSRNSYNLALNICTKWKAGATLRIVQACLAFTSAYPANSDSKQASDLGLRRLFCNFLECCLLAVLARAEDDVEKQV